MFKRLAALAAAMLVMACGTLFAKDAKEAAAPAKTPEPIKIGAIFAVTGPAAFLGAPEQKTAQMLVDEINAAGGVKGQSRKGRFLRQTTDRGGKGFRHHRSVHERRNHADQGAVRPK